MQAEFQMFWPSFYKTSEFSLNNLFWNETNSRLWADTDTLSMQNITKFQISYSVTTGF